MKKMVFLFALFSSIVFLAGRKFKVTVTKRLLPSLFLGYMFFVMAGMISTVCRADNTDCINLPVDLNESGSTFYLRTLDTTEWPENWDVANGILGPDGLPLGFAGFQQWFFRIGDKGPIRPFSSLDICIKKTSSNRLDVFFTENNQMVRIPIHSVKARSVCTDQSICYNPEEGCIDNQFPKGCLDCVVRCNFYPPDEDKNMWHVRLAQATSPAAGDPLEVPLFIEGIKVKLRPNPNYIPITAQGTVDEDTYLQCGDDCALYVPKWWAEHVFGFGPFFPCPCESDFDTFCVLGDSEIAYWSDSRDHADQPLNQLSVAPRFRANLSFIVWGGRNIARFDESLHIEAMNSNNTINLDLSQYNGAVFLNTSSSNLTKVLSTYWYYGFSKPPAGYLTAFSGLGDKFPDTMDYPCYREYPSCDRNEYPAVPYPWNSWEYPKSWIWSWENVLADDSLTITTSFNIAGEQNKMLGDVNNDGCVDQKDFQAILSRRRSLAYDPLYDLNGDGSVNIVDARRSVVLFSEPDGAPCPQFFQY